MVAVSGAGAVEVGKEGVVELGAIRGADAGRVGPKMARLGQLAADGWRVPDGYAVTAAALDGWLPATARGELARLFTAPVPDAASGQEDVLPRRAGAPQAPVGEHAELIRSPAWRITKNPIRATGSVSLARLAGSSNWAATCSS